MGKVTYSDSLALLGIIAAIVLLVLDKAGKMKGATLLVALGVAALMTLPLALGNPWVLNASSGVEKFSRGMLMFFVVGLIYSGLAAWVSYDDAGSGKASELKKDESTAKLDLNNIHIFFARAHGYLGAATGPKEDDMHRYIVPSEPFKLFTSPRQFAFGVDNRNAGILLNNARITFSYHGDIPIQITRTHTKEDGHYWQEYSTGIQYFYDFKKPVNGGWNHSWGALVIKFPGPGEYKFDLAVTSDEIEGSNPIKTYLRIIVDKSAFSKKRSKPNATN